MRIILRCLQCTTLFQFVAPENPSLAHPAQVRCNACGRVMSDEDIFVQVRDYVQTLLSQLPRHVD
jgi:hypothetical protein